MDGSTPPFALLSLFVLSNDQCQSFLVQWCSLLAYNTQVFLLQLDLLPFLEKPLNLFTIIVFCFCVR
jgi:hypothetical protein